ncbi:hypothetical protein SAMN02746009_04209 [Hymenobacter psychrotolerans DSM 18569]|uniref:DDE superfamily endonuclease n=1 Tax=Hymenobacter psychrotolerans DSM 18569 TaxID=1121959 RepID=A0A1M7F6T6_9BACT|nr:hypothetical protein SAMN02746009_00001 [Hymenobacter psychrotolerans DSM 18569]SHK40036.1 hypothetical protein SAMN02746009_00885 [Hymenobacter psychrotolerans DSM 18569]SHL77033.1 hypothetical protein SAMN02746009_03336 [Hymenobacter psychrotolerans DSM 18569]SHL99720.1 hypothetical protein SAMN02746009_03765 [Hymenobacter psychrotolerans DSM 18569]SHM23106.1 hypothetical protein SAMN02746009_04155 [Hymenobacter psychrotolerans DSM 18569]
MPTGMKRLRMVQDTLRLRGQWRRDTVIVVACGLHNLRVRSPLRLYAPDKFPKLSE